MADEERLVFPGRRRSDARPRAERVRCCARRDHRAVRGGADPVSVGGAEHGPWWLPAPTVEADANGDGVAEHVPSDSAPDRRAPGDEDRDVELASWFPRPPA